MATLLGFSDASSGSSACIIRDGIILAAIDEERIRRIKYCGGFPELAIKEVIQIAKQIIMQKERDKELRRRKREDRDKRNKPPEGDDAA